MSKGCIDHEQYTKFIPFYFKNKTERNITTDYYHLKIPKKPHYVIRTLLTPEKEYYEMMTVASEVYKHIIIFNINQHK